MELDYSKNLPRRQETEEERQARKTRNRALKMKQRALLRDGKEMLRALVRNFPLCFTAPYAPKRPVKLNIRADLMQQMPLDREDQVRAALHRYNCHRSYRMSLIEGAIRVDLDGNPAGRVTWEEAHDARAAVQAIDAKNAREEKRKNDARSHRLGKSNQGVPAGSAAELVRDPSGGGRHRYHDEVMAGSSDGLEANATPRDRGGSQITEHTNA